MQQGTKYEEGVPVTEVQGTLLRWGDVVTGTKKLISNLAL